MWVVGEEHLSGAIYVSESSISRVPTKKPVNVVIGFREQRLLEFLEIPERETPIPANVYCPQGTLNHPAIDLAAADAHQGTDLPDR